MAEFFWVPIRDGRIGTVYLSLCDIEIQNSYGVWQTFTFKVDSGADMTLMEEGDYYSLGYNFHDNDKIDFTDVQDKAFTTKIGKLNMKIDGHVIDNVPVAFSKKTNSDIVAWPLEDF
jgi:hypothetical protein